MRGANSGINYWTSFATLWNLLSGRCWIGRRRRPNVVSSLELLARLHGVPCAKGKCFVLGLWLFGRFSPRFLFHQGGRSVSGEGVLLFVFWCGLGVMAFTFTVGTRVSCCYLDSAWSFGLADYTRGVEV